MYLFDANVFMTAANSYYSFELAPSFWSWLEQSDVQRCVASVVAVREEITRGHGALAEWAARLPPAFWLADDDASMSVMGDLAQWANAPKRLFRPAAVAQFMDSADIRLISVAAAHDHVVVSHETPAPQSKTTVKIPDACSAVEATHANPFSVLRNLGLRL